MTFEAIEALYRELTEDSNVAPGPQPLPTAFAAIAALLDILAEDGPGASKPEAAPVTLPAAERLRKEQALLQTYFPSFRIQFPDDPAKVGAVGALTTNAGNEYALWIPLGAFPNEPPQMFVVQPQNLRNRRGKKLAKVGVNSAMHLLAPNAHGHPQICHHNDASWTPNITLYKVAMKGRLWLEAYEMHKATGKDIDHYLPHM